MYTVQLEPITVDFARDADALALLSRAAICKAIPEADAMPPYMIKWDQYLTVHDTILSATARDFDDDSLLGFIIYNVYEHPHHTGMIVGFCTIIMSHPEHRGEGIGKAMCAFMEPHLKDAGVTTVLHGHRLMYNTKPMFESLGYSLVDHIYAKEIA
jgi:GNAT superfamily N-acetyltransferase